MEIDLKSIQLDDITYSKVTAKLFNSNIKLRYMIDMNKIVLF